MEQGQGVGVSDRHGGRIAIMLLDEHESLCMIEYLGCLHTFIIRFHGALATIGYHTLTLEGQTRRQAFGWAGSLDRARYDLTLVVEKWRFFNESAGSRLTASPAEVERFGALPSVERALEVCRELEDMAGRANRYIDALESFGEDDVRIVLEMMKAIEHEIQPDAAYIAPIAGCMARSEPEAKTPEGLLSIGSMEDSDDDDPSELFFDARDRFLAYLGEGSG